MDINLYILQHELSKWDLVANITDAPSTLNCTHPIPYVKGMDFFSGPVYVCRAQDLPVAPAHISFLNLVCIGEPPASYLKPPFNVLYTHDNTLDHLALLSDCMSVFAKYEAWGKRLEGIVERGGALRELGTASLAIIDNPISVWSAGYKELFFVHGKNDGSIEVLKDPTAFEKSLGALREGEFISLDDIKVFARSEEFNKSVETGEPSIYDGYPCGYECRSLIYAIKRLGNIAAYLIIDEANHALTACDSAQAIILAGYVARLLDRAPSSQTNAKSIMVDIVSDLAQGKMVSAHLVKHAVKAIGWDNTDILRVIALDVDSEHHTVVINAIAALIHERFDSVILPVHANIQGLPKGSLVNQSFSSTIYYLVNTKSIDTIYDNLIKYLPSNVVAKVRTVGISEPFVVASDLWEIKHFAHQACAAVQLGPQVEELESNTDKESSAPTLSASATTTMPRIFYYADVYAYDMASLCMQDAPVVARIPSSLRRLMRHDKAENDNLVQLLSQYLSCNLSITKTARIAYLSRNTCISKVNRIKDIMQVDFNNPQTVLGLWMAVEILDVSHGKTAR